MTHQSLRRADRALTHDDTLATLDAASFVTVSTSDEEGAPYGVPLSFVRRGETLYFHMSNEGGLKVDCFRHDARACATAVTDVEAFYEDGDFTTAYRSALAFGSMREVTDAGEFKHALVDLCMKYVPAHRHDIGHAMEVEGPNAAVWALDIDELSGKARPRPAADSQETD